MKRATEQRRLDKSSKANENLVLRLQYGAAFRADTFDPTQASMYITRKCGLDLRSSVTVMRRLTDGPVFLYRTIVDDEILITNEEQTSPREYLGDYHVFTLEEYHLDLMFSKGISAYFRRLFSNRKIENLGFENF